MALTKGYSEDKLEMLPIISNSLHCVAMLYWDSPTSSVKSLPNHRTQDAFSKISRTEVLWLVYRSFQMNETLLKKKKILSQTWGAMAVGCDQWSRKCVVQEHKGMSPSHVYCTWLKAHKLGHRAEHCGVRLWKRVSQEHTDSKPQQSTMDGSWLRDTSVNLVSRY